MKTIQSQDKKLNFYIDNSLVRGLDYYNRTVFEFQPSETSSQGTILAGGRYDPLVSKIGGPDTPGIGFGSGIERIILEIKKQSIEPVYNKNFEVVVIDNLSVGRRENISHLNENPKFTFVDADISNFDLIEPIFRGADWVFHLAALADIGTDQGIFSENENKYIILFMLLIIISLTNVSINEIQRLG